MGLFERLFGVLLTDEEEPKITFGRFTDAHKSEAQYRAWDEAVIAFREQRYLDCFELFLDYLRQEDQDNIIKEHKGDRIEFHIHQGSKCVHGTYGPERIYAEAKIVKIKEFSIGYLRRLVEYNSGLNYSRYCIDANDHISLIFDAHVRDSPPEKLYYAFKETANNADKQDDLLLEEFKSLEHLDESIIIESPQEIKETKYRFLKESIEKVLNQIEQIRVSPDKQQGAISYMLLALVYKLDFLIVPQGRTMEVLERLHRKYFHVHHQSAGQKNVAIIKELVKLKDRDKASYLAEFYEVSSTFGITGTISGKKMNEFIDTEISYIQWYIQNGYKDVAMTVCSYVVGYLLFNYTVPKPAFQLFNLYYRIIECDYFQRLGFTELYNSADDRFEQNRIKSILKEIESSNRDEYPKLNFELDTLNFNNPVEFARSFVLFVRNIDFTKKKNKNNKL